MPQRIKESLKRPWRAYMELLHYLRTGIWSEAIVALPSRRRGAVRFLRIVLLVFRGFTENNLQLRASALTFYALMSMVPVLALGFGIAKGFGLDNRLDTVIREKLAEYPELAAKLVEFSNALLDRTGGGLIAGIGVAMLFWAAVKLLHHIELSFNAIWQINKQRRWFRKFSDYLSMMIIAPLLIIAASSANVYVQSTLRKAAANVEIVGLVKPYVLISLRVAPYILVSLVLGILYMIMPNTRVRPRSALIAGLVAGAGFVLTQWGYLYFQIGMSKYNAIYGSFAAVPLFLVWMQISWLIVLLGAELSYAMQNVHLYEYEHETLNLSSKRTKELSLLLLTTVVGRFRAGAAAPTSEELAVRHGLPLRLTRRLLQWMVEMNLLTLVASGSEQDEAYQPGLSIEHLTLGYVLEKYDSFGSTIAAKGSLLSHIEELYDEYIATRADSGESIGDLAARETL